MIFTIVLLGLFIIRSFGKEDAFEKVSNSVTFVPSDGVKHDLYASRGGDSGGPKSNLRWRRDVENLDPLSSDEVEESLRIHNALRRLEPAADMEYMIWNSYLADMATEWSATCIWGHGQPPRNASTMPFNPVGQNLYLSTGSTINITFLSLRWYSEKPYYNFNNATCQKNQMCGHYTQVVWSQSRQVGCGKYLCAQATDAATNEIYNNAWIFGCNYGPAGNVNGLLPYRIGEPCLYCIAGQMWCDKESPRGLCRRDCNQNLDRCECKANCRNQGSLNSSYCTCQCAAGWGDFDCGMPCCDYSTYCGKQWPRFACNDRSAGDLIRSFCFLTCGQCTASPGSNNSAACPFVSTTTNPSTAQTTTVPLVASSTSFASTSSSVPRTSSVFPSPTSISSTVLSTSTSTQTTSTSITTTTTTPTTAPSTPTTLATTPSTPSTTIATTTPSTPAMSTTTPTTATTTPISTSTTTTPTSTSTTTTPTSTSTTTAPTSTSTTTSTSVATSTRLTQPRSSTTFFFTISRTTPLLVTSPSTYVTTTSTTVMTSTLPGSSGVSSVETTTYGDGSVPANSNQSLWLIIILSTVAAIIVLVVAVVIILLIMCRKIKQQAQRSSRLETDLNDLRPVAFNSVIPTASAPTFPENPNFKNDATITKYPYAPTMEHLYPQQQPPNETVWKF